MNFSPEFLAQLKSRVVLSDLIGARVKLIRRGRNLVGLCPFHSEKSPSFHVHDDQGNYHCFGCGVHGDALTFVMETEGLSFPETIERLANQVDLPLPLQREETQGQVSEIKAIYEALELSCTWFQRQLSTSEGRQAKQYLLDRGVREEPLQKFRLGFAPQGNQLKSFLKLQGIKERTLIKAGLVIDKETDSFDRFRSRIMFPIFDRTGKVIAFGGRILGEGEPKYLNSPETPVFHKGHVLYAYNFARKSTSKNLPAIVAEGYLDVIALHQAGFTKAVAPLGTAMTEDQLKLLWSLSGEPILCFDGDTAGQKAAERAALRMLPILEPGYSARFARLPQGEDPDSLVQSGATQTLEKTFTAALPLSDVLWQLEMRNQTLKTPEQKAYLEKRILGRVQEIKNPSVKTHYQDDYRKRLNTLFYSLNSRQGSFKRGLDRNLSAIPTGGNQVRVNAEILQRKILFAAILNHPSILHEVLEQFVELALSAEKLNQLRDAIVFKINEHEGLDAGTLQHHLYNEGFTEALRDILSDDVYLHASFARPKASTDAALEGWHEIWKRLCVMKALKQDTLHAKKTLSEEMTTAAWLRMQRLNGQVEEKEPDFN